MKSQAGTALWRSEIDRLVAKIEETIGRQITADSLRAAITTINAKRQALARLNSLHAADPASISGRDALLINPIQFYDDSVRFTDKLNGLCDELESRIEQKVNAAPTDAPRILVASCPMAAPNWKVPFLVEKNGAVIVAEERRTDHTAGGNPVPAPGDGLQYGGCRTTGDPHPSVPGGAGVNGRSSMGAAGLDIGSRSVELIVLDASEGAVVSSVQVKTPPNVSADWRRLLGGVSYDSLIVTGYGRGMAEVKFDAPSVAEIKAFTRNAEFVPPGCSTVLDIGGQDTKAICLDGKGRVTKFEMNDRCAADAGRFLEVMAAALDYDLAAFGPAALEGGDQLQLSSMCTVPQAQQ